MKRFMVVMREVWSVRRRVGGRRKSGWSRDGDGTRGLHCDRSLLHEASLSVHAAITRLKIVCKNSSFVSGAVS